MLRKSIVTLLAVLAASFPAASMAQDEAEASAETLTWSGYELAVFGPADRVAVSEEAGREVLSVTRTNVILAGSQFSEGVIEFDIALDSARGFGGILWHASETHSEYFYLRKHKSGLPDAGQYTPIRNGITSWQIYTDRNGIAPFAFTEEGWNRFKLVVEGDRADIYFNGSPEPVMHIPDLAADQGSGAIGFQASGPNGVIRVSNFSMRPLSAGEGVVGTRAADRTAPDGVIERWSVSQRFAESVVEGALSMPAELGLLDTLGTLAVEPYGIADISRLTGPEENLDSVLVSTRITSDSARKVRLNFGYSDRVRLFLNGELVFDGIAQWRSRDFFFLGTIGFNDAVMLDLEEGENHLVAAVSETFGGWGFAAAIEDGEGLVIAP
ncbi:hypothetical protein [uncultured Erythrobacter sp.]|uniref:hypothetical protein n=1 Tax=uncultured Erythrobacter sp. TaxID=263913 RepID=UPI00262F42DE|nr:hypothetical protein [uncultured Erythrobacter sp.]